MAKPRSRPLPPEVQQEKDLLELVGYPAFRRFLFTIAQKSGICGTTYGTDIDASIFEGRRSLGIEIFRLVDEALPVRVPESSPFNALALAIAEAQTLQLATMEDRTNETQNDMDDFERR